MNDDLANGGHARLGVAAMRRLMRLLAVTAEQEIDCSTCLASVPAYVDREVTGIDVQTEMPDLWRHLALCGDCMEEYEALRDLATLEAQGSLPTRAALRDALDHRHG